MKKKWEEIWKIVEIPVYIMVVYNLIAIPILVYGYMSTMMQGILGWCITLGAFGYIGYLVKKSGKKAGEAAKSGAFAGVIVGLVSGIMGIVALNFFPQIYTDAIEQAVATGAPRETMETIIKASVYFGLITGPLFSAAIGAGISALANVLSKK